MPEVRRLRCSARRRLGLVGRALKTDKGTHKDANIRK
jgi:hypothetical protein